MTNLRRYSITAISERFDWALIAEDRNILTEHYCTSDDVSALEAENERLGNDNAVLRDLAAAANPPKLSPEQLQRLRDLEQEKP